MSAATDTLNGSWEGMTIAGASTAVQQFMDKMQAMAASLNIKNPLDTKSGSVAETGQMVAQNVGGKGNSESIGNAMS